MVGQLNFAPLHKKWNGIIVFCSLLPSCQKVTTASSFVEKHADDGRVVVVVVVVVGFSMSPP